MHATPDLQLHAGLGAYGQYLHKNTTLAKEIDYTIPCGMQVWVNMSYAYKKWECAAHATMPFILNDKNAEFKKHRACWKKYMYYVQISVQYKIIFN
jgi:hypothetical protein